MTRIVLKEIAVGRRDMLMIDPARIEVDPTYNVRHDRPELEQHIEMLMESIRVQGVLTPLVIRTTDDGKVLVVAGHCRLAAIARLANEGHVIKAVPCISEERGMNEEKRDLHQIASNTHLAQSAVERNELYDRLRKRGWSNKDIAEKVGLDKKSIDNLELLGTLDQETTNLIQADVVSSTEVIKEIRKQGPVKAMETVKAAAKTAIADKKAGVGKGKVTAKTIAATKAPPSSFAPGRSRLVNTPAKFKELVDVMHCCLELNDPKLMHIAIRDALNIKTK